MLGGEYSFAEASVRKEAEQRDNIEKPDKKTQNYDKSMWKYLNCQAYTKKKDHLTGKIE